MIGKHAMLHRLLGKRLPALVLAAALLAGCSGLNLSTPEPVELSFVYLDQAADYEPLAEEFHKQHPNITIKLDPARTTGGGGARELTLKIESADALRVPVQSIPSELSAGFLPLDSMMSTAKSLPLDDAYPNTLDGLKQDGKQMGLPAGLNPFVVYYLPKKLEAAGVPAPAPDWTLEDFVTSASALNNPDSTLAGTERYGYGYCTHPQLTDIPLISYLFGGRLFDSLVQVSTPTLNERGNIEALSWYASLRNDFGIVPPSQNVREIGALIYRGGCGYWFDMLDKSTFGSDGAVGAEPLPLPRGQASFNIAAQDGYFIMVKSEHPEEAFQWISFLMQQQSASGKLIPPLTTQVESSEYAARVSGQVVNVARSLGSDTVILSIEMLRNERFNQALNYFSQAARKVVFDGEDAQSALDEAQRQAEAAIQ